jgi:hypothetical protein
VVEGQMFGTETVNASTDIIILCASCLPRPMSQQISDLREHNCMVIIEWGGVKIEGVVVEKCKLVVKTLKMVVKYKQLITFGLFDQEQLAESTKNMNKLSR